MPSLAAVLATLCMVIIAVGGCRGRPSERAPIHLNPNMDIQEKYRPQGESRFFADSAAMRVPVPGTVARGDLREDAVYHTGKTADGEYVTVLPVEVTMQTLRRGRERYDIYCSPCHSRVGDGRGIMVERGYVPPPTFHQDYVRDKPDGYIFDVITSGVRNMPPYAGQITVADRWAIVAYVRALQRSRDAAIDDVPEELRTTIREAGQ